MSEIVLHERMWVENMMREHSIGKKPLDTLSRIARVYYADGYKKKDIGGKLEDYIIQCDPTANITKWQNIIDYSVRSCDKYPLIDINSINITKSELEAIHKLNGRMMQKLMFTLTSVAKYGNAVNPMNNNWVNYSTKDIFSLANIVLTTKRQSLMINDLWHDGYLGYSQMVDNINLNVKIIDDSTPSVYSICDFRNLGNQYMMLEGEGYIACSVCGCIVKKGSNRQSYCKACGDEMNRQKTREKYVKVS